MASTTMIHVRIDEETKTAAAATLASMGLSLSDAVRVFLTRVVADNELPFSIKAPEQDKSLCNHRGRSNHRTSRCALYQR